MECPETFDHFAFHERKALIWVQAYVQLSGQNEPNLLCKSPVGGANTSLLSSVNEACDVVAVADSSQTGTWFCPPDRIIVDSVDDAPARTVDATVLKPTTIL